MNNLEFQKLLQDTTDASARTNTKKYWLVRTDDGANYDTFSNGNFVALNLQDIPVDFIRQVRDQGTPKERIAAIKEKMMDLQTQNRITLPYSPLDNGYSSNMGRLAGQIDSIALEMKYGDIVLIPSQGASSLKIGKIIDADLATDEEITRTFSFARKVEWIKEISKKRLEANLYKALGAHQAVCDLENLSCSTDNNKTKYIKEKSKLLENNIVSLFKSIFGRYVKCYTSYYVDDCEQDILILWKDNAFIIEAKAYDIKEPFRDPERAYKRILQDFNRSIGYAYKQTWRVAEKFYKQEPLEIKDEHGALIDTIDTAKYKNGDFSIIVTQKSFGQIQADLSNTLDIEEGGFYPWAIKYDDLDVFLRTIKALHKKPQFLVDFLLDREALHGHVICSDELQICGGYLMDELTSDICQSDNLIACSPELASIFDEQYRKGLGFKNERHWTEKHDGKTLFV